MNSLCTSVISYTDLLITSDESQLSSFNSSHHISFYLLKCRRREHNLFHLQLIRGEQSHAAGNTVQHEILTGCNVSMVYSDKFLCLHFLIAFSPSFLQLSILILSPLPSIFWTSNMSRY